ncbi:hypothetical protein REPUB_Repub03eG0268900 [Reevesia pubescens]
MRSLIWVKAIVGGDFINDADWWNYLFVMDLGNSQSLARVDASWLCPRKNILKFNTDGSVVIGSGIAGMGVVLRDSDGNVRGIFNGPLAEDMQVIIAELWAIKTALNLFSSSHLLGYSFLIVESDSKTAMSWICNKELRLWKERRFLLR